MYWKLSLWSVQLQPIMGSLEKEILVHRSDLDSSPGHLRKDEGCALSFASALTYTYGQLAGQDIKLCIWSTWTRQQRGT